jgi:hypothetical protein
MLTKKAILLLGAVAMTAGACASGPHRPTMRRVDPRADDDLGGTLIDSADVIAITDRAAHSLSQTLLQMPRNDIVISYAPIKNESIQPFNTAMLTDRMRDAVARETGARVRFRATEQLDEIRKERDAKRAGEYSGGSRGPIAGADYLLTGRITSLSKRYEGDRADYFLLAFELVDAESGLGAWSNRYEFKKEGGAGVIYR